MSYQITLHNDLIVDYFAGGGGASQAIEQALHRTVDVAVNHDKAAVAMHTANHPNTVHKCQDVHDVDPRELAAGRRILLAHFSPDCKHFSKAKGGALLDRKIRDLAWVVHRFTSLPQDVKPLVITLENVEEFTTWGPLLENGKPCPRRKGHIFKAFINAFKRNGYAVEWKELRACDYGAPTIRKRLFLIARCDGEAIVWPAPTHGDPRKPGFKESGLKPWHTAAEIIDWSIPATSIFEPGRDLAENTLRRVARGMKRYVIDAEKPFIVTCNHGGDWFRGQGLDEPLCTLTAARDAHGLVQACMIGAGGPAYAGEPRGMDRPMQTLTTRNHSALVGAALVGCGGRMGQSPERSVEEPMQTVTAKADSCVMAAHMIQHNGGFYDGAGRGMDEPLATITTTGGQTQVSGAVFISKLRGTSTAAPADEPLHTVSAGGKHHAPVCAVLVKYYGNERDGCDLQEPLHTITTKDRFALAKVERAVPQTMTDEQRYNAWWVMRFLEDYDAVPHSENHMHGPRPSMLMLGDSIMVDIVMRMLKPHELAKGQGFDPNYIIDYGMFLQDDGTLVKKKLTQSEQVMKIGNSVSPPPYRAIVKANVWPLLMFKPATGKRKKREAA